MAGVSYYQSEYFDSGYFGGGSAGGGSGNGYFGSEFFSSGFWGTNYFRQPGGVIPPVPTPTPTGGGRGSGGWRDKTHGRHIAYADGRVRSFPDEASYRAEIARLLRAKVPEAVIVEEPAAQPEAKRQQIRLPEIHLRPEVFALAARLAGEAEALRIEALVAESAALYRLHRIAMEDEELLIAISQIV